MSRESAAAAARTPWHLWVVGILALLWNAMGAFDYLMTQTENEAYMAAFTPEQLEFFYGFPVWLVAFWATAVWGSVLASVFLLLRKKWATPVFLVSLACLIVTATHNFGLSNGYEVMGAAGVGFTLAIFATSCLLPLYSWRMASRGVLR
ncbi:MAG: hypothetical protein GY716_00655 [bacterium]|nr:hypothetical protein [bacterium]